MAGDYIGNADTVGALIDILQSLPAEAKVRVRTLSHTWPPDVRDHGEIDGIRYITLEP